MYLDKDTRKVAGEFVAGGLWLQIKRALVARRPVNSEATESAETAAHRAFERKGYEKCLEDIEALVTESAPDESPLIPATLTDPRD